MSQGLNASAYAAVSTVSGKSIQIKRLAWIGDYFTGPQSAFLGIVAVLELLRYYKQPALLYPLDDSYIHMALSHTLLTSGTWGMNPGDWAAASSSPLWTIILAAFAWVPSPAVPLLLNILIGSLFIAFLERLPPPWSVSGQGQASNRPLAWTVFYAAPLPLLAILGMEHLLHAFLVVLLAYYATRAISADADTKPASPWTIAPFSALAMLCRYESLAPVALLTVMALGFGRWRIALALLAGLIPTVALGLLWINHGGQFLPNSIYLKPQPLDHHSLLALVHNLKWRIEWQFHARAWLSAATTMAILLISIGTFLGSRCWQTLRKWRTLLLLTAIGATVFQFFFGALGWLYRYEAWLLVLNVFAVSYFIRPYYYAAAMLLILMPRAVLDGSDTMSAMQDRFYEHYLPALFVRSYNGHAPVVVNDLGVMAYYDRTPVRDMFGLGSNEPLRMRLTHSYDAAHVAAWVAQTGAPLAVLQPCWPIIASVTPASWQPIALWIIPHNSVFADRAVAFYSTSPAQAVLLRQDMIRFDLTLAVYPELHHYLLPVGAKQQELQRMAKCDM
jgi:hypothetical protein